MPLDIRRLAIIADDLTGAADTGVQFAAQGLRTALIPHIFVEIAHGLDDYSVITATTNSRGLSARQAYNKVEAEARILAEKLAPEMAYKKIDSTLRGSPGAEIEATMRAMHKDVALAAPAFPACGRITKNGIHFVNGRRLEETEVAFDPVSPVLESHIPSLLRSQTSLAVGQIGIEEVRTCPVALKESVVKRVASGEKIIVLDAMDDNDLANIVQAALMLPFSPLLTGSGGLAARFADSLGGGELRSSPSRGISGCEGKGSIVVISGSLSAVTSAQLDRLQEATRAEIISIETHKLVDNTGSIDKLYSRLLLAMKTGRVAGIRSVRKSQGDASGKESEEKQYMASRVAGYIGKLVGKLVRDCPYPIQALLLCGGDTTLEVFRALGITRVELMEQILPGIPCGRVEGGRLSGLTIVTKAGAFGDENALIKCIEFLTNGAAQR